MEETRRSHESKVESDNAKSSDAGSDRHLKAGGGAPPTEANRSRFRSRKAIIAIAIGCIVLLGLALGLGLGLGLKSSKNSHVKKGQTSKPNVLVVMVDDQDLKLDSMSVMPNVNRLFGEQGTTFDRHYCTVAWCCPSRVNFLTGRAAHNTNVTSTAPPYGGWQKFSEQGLNDDYLPVWINETGIGTYYVGKFINGLAKGDFHRPAYPNAWTRSEMLIDPWTYQYYNSHWTNGYTTDISSYKGIHTTTVTMEKSLAMLDNAVGTGNQFFMMVAPVAPHQEIAPTRPPPIPEQYKGVFNNRTAPRTENFNPKERTGASWVYAMDRLDAKGIKNCDVTYYHRLANIAYIDDMVNELVQRLDDHGILDNTYVIYTSDNGFHIGNHRLPPGKRCPYEEDVNIPLLMRGPDIAKGKVSNITNSHTDMAPTILQMLGVPLRKNFDGAPIAYSEKAMASSTKTELVNVEFWTSQKGSPLGVKHGTYYNNTYKALRMMTEDYSLFYSTWCTGEREFYDMANDEQQMHNLLTPGTKGDTTKTYYDRSQAALVHRLDAVLMVTKTCKEESCRNPWGVLFPKGEVTSLRQAMAEKYDSFFEVQPKVSFQACTLGYIESKELPLHVKAFSPGKQYVLS